MGGVVYCHGDAIWAELAPADSGGHQKKGEGGQGQEAWAKWIDMGLKDGTTRGEAWSDESF